MKSKRILIKDAEERGQVKRLFVQLREQDYCKRFQSVLIPRFRTGLVFPSISANEICNIQSMQ